MLKRDLRKVEKNLRLKRRKNVKKSFPYFYVCDHAKIILGQIANDVTAKLYQIKNSFEC